MNMLPCLLRPSARFYRTSEHVCERERERDTVYWCRLTNSIDKLLTTKTFQSEQLSDTVWGPSPPSPFVKFLPFWFRPRRPSGLFWWGNIQERQQLDRGTAPSVKCVKIHLSLDCEAPPRSRVSRKKTASRELGDTSCHDHAAARQARHHHKWCRVSPAESEEVSQTSESGLKNKRGFRRKLRRSWINLRRLFFHGWVWPSWQKLS